MFLLKSKLTHHLYLILRKTNVSENELYISHIVASETCLPLRDPRGALRVVLGEAAAIPQAIITSWDRRRGGRGWLTVLIWCAGRGGRAGAV